MKRRRRRNFISLIIGLTITLTALSGCGVEERPDYETIVKGAKEEGKVVSLAMPDEWANWGETWSDMALFYNLNHSDTDMNSAEELKEFGDGKGDIGDVGYNYGAQAEKEGLTHPFITSYWDEIPDWAKDDDGDWIVAYTGTLAFMVKDASKEVSLGWKDLAEGKYTVGTSDVTTSSQAQYTVYAAALAFGGSKENVQPGIDFFKKLATEGRLNDTLEDEKTSLASQVDVNIKWDFNALGYRDTAVESGKQYGVCIPNDGSITIGYASIINKKAENLNSAMLAREYILSDGGQLNLAKGYATPIRSIVLPENLEEKRIPREQYTDEMIQAGLSFDDSVGDKIAKLWKEQVLPELEKGGRAK